MKQFLVLALAACAIAPALAQTNVGVSIGIDRPGVYGRIDIGSAPPPPVIYSQPVIYAPTPVAVYQRPIYLHVPPGQQKNWGKHCARYGACGQPVYFVQERWVQQHFDNRDRDDNRDHRPRKEKKAKHQKGNQKGNHGHR